MRTERDDQASQISRKDRFVHFFTLSDIRITDKEASNQIIYFQPADRFAINHTSIYSLVLTAHLSSMWA